MTPAARLSAAIEVLDAVFAGDPADRALTRWGRASRFAGSGDRAAVADIVYAALRRKRSRAWRMGAETGRALVIAGAEAEGQLALFSGEGHAPAPLSDAERAALERPQVGAPEPVALDFPDWLEMELRRSLGDRLAPVMQAMRERAPLDLRVNRLKCDGARAAAALAEDGVETTPGPLSPLCLRVVAGARRLRRAAAYRDGLVEIQDAASQAAAEFAEAAPGETVLDYCAGGGGKSLALAATGARVVAHDAKPARMKDIPPRAARAGVEIEIHAAPPGRLRDACDLVFVDAPCSGAGAWRRNPDAKWTLTPEELDRLVALQGQILSEAARFVRPGGRLVYATCSLLRVENSDQAERFLSGNADFSLRGEMRLTPLDDGDGFYVACLRRASRN